MQGAKLPAKYVNEVGMRHKSGETYEQIVEAMRGRYSFCSLGSVHRALTNWRRKNKVDSPLTIAKKLSVEIIRKYESTDCTMRVADLVDWANANAPRTDRPWTRQLIAGLLRNWKIKTGENQWRDRLLATWEAIHELFTTGYSGQQAADELNRRGVLNYEDKWTEHTVWHFHARHASKFNITLESAMMRTERETLEIAFLLSSLRVDGYTVDQAVDRFNEHRLYFFRGRSWTYLGLKTVYYRARSILRELEGVQSMSAAIESIDNQVVTAAAMAAITPDAVQLRVVGADDAHQEESKVDRLKRVAYRVAELRDEGMRAPGIVDLLDREHPRAGGWTTQLLDAVEQYGERHVEYRRRARDPVVMQLLVDRMIKDRATMKHREMAHRWNDQSVPNEISPGSQWTVDHLTAVWQWHKNRVGRKNKEKPAEPTQQERVTGRRAMRPADVAMREHARAKLAIRDEAFARAAEIHKQIERLNAQLAEAKHLVEQGDEAESLLIQTGPAPLVEELNRLKDGSNHNNLDGQAESIDQITQRICTEDWR